MRRRTLWRSPSVPWRRSPQQLAGATDPPIRPGRQRDADRYARVGVSFGLRQDEAGGTRGRHPIKITAVDKATGAKVRVKSWNEHTPGRIRSWATPRTAAPKREAIDEVSAARA